MNLYAISADYSPAPMQLHLFADDAQALDHAVYVAAHDAVRGDGSPSATVYLVATDVTIVGKSLATAAPAEWTWAHPGVEQNEAALENLEREFSLASGEATGRKS